MNPYSDLPKSCFWRTGVVDQYPELTNIYSRKFNITASDKIATAGSCFAQHISRRMKTSGYKVLDCEPAPAGLPTDRHGEYGYGLYSARYGNIYTVQQLLQLAREALGQRTLTLPVWQRRERYIDALRPGIEPHGLASHDEVLMHRRVHLQNVRKLFLTMDVFIFTLGLTEHWVDAATDLVLPIAPGTMGGRFDPDRYVFRNAAFGEVVRDFNAFQMLLQSARGGRRVRTILTVSPVPLTATYADRHVLTSTNASKAILRAAADQISTNQAHVDYFPSYEIVTNPAARGAHYTPDLRSVEPTGVDAVMAVFFGQHCSLKDSDDNVAAPAQSRLLRFHSAHCNDGAISRHVCCLRRTFPCGRVKVLMRTLYIGSSLTTAFFRWAQETGSSTSDSFVMMHGAYFMPNRLLGGSFGIDGDVLLVPDSFSVRRVDGVVVPQRTFALIAGERPPLGPFKLDLGDYDQVVVTALMLFAEQSVLTLYRQGYGLLTAQTEAAFSRAGLVYALSADTVVAIHRTWFAYAHTLVEAAAKGGRTVFIAPAAMPQGKLEFFCPDWRIMHWYEMEVVFETLAQTAGAVPMPQPLDTLDEMNRTRPEYMADGDHHYNVRFVEALDLAYRMSEPPLR